MHILVGALFVVFTVIAVAGVVVHIRVLMQAKPGMRSLLKKALMRHNWDMAAHFLQPAGLVDLARLRTVIDWMFKAGGTAFLLVAILAVFGVIGPSK